MSKSYSQLTVEEREARNAYRRRVRQEVRDGVRWEPRWVRNQRLYLASRARTRAEVNRERRALAARRLYTALATLNTSSDISVNLVDPDVHFNTKRRVAFVTVRLEVPLDSS